MAGSILPRELLAGAFAHLSPSGLARVSCVCRTWKTVAFPLLYRTVYLCLATHLEEFIQRVHTEEAGNQLSIASHIKGLVLDIAYLQDRSDEMIRKSGINNLNAVIPRLTQLSFLSWNLLFVPDEPETFRLFQSQCPKLNSVDLWIKTREDFNSDRYDSLFKFKGLSYFALSIWDMPPSFDEDQIDPLVSLLGNCPQLSSIILDFNHHEWQYSPTVVVAALGDQFVFPNLRRFYAQGRSVPGWIDFFDDPESHPFRQFFHRHPGIEDLALGFVHEYTYSGEIDPTSLVQLFPSLKYFEGPAFLFKPLVLSTLANQIEKLILVDDPLEEDSSIDLGGSNITLPKLRRFGIWANEIEEDILVNTLRAIVSAADQLEEIEIHPEIDDTNYEEVFSLLTQVKNLCSVTLDESILTAAAEDEEQLEWDAFASILRRACPKLRTIYQTIEKIDKDNRKKVWDLHDNA